MVIYCNSMSNPSKYNNNHFTSIIMEIVYLCPTLGLKCGRYGQLWLEEDQITWPNDWSRAIRYERM